MLGPIHARGPSHFRVTPKSASFLVTLDCVARGNKGAHAFQFARHPPSRRLCVDKPCISLRDRVDNKKPLPTLMHRFPTRRLNPAGGTQSRPDALRLSKPYRDIADLRLAAVSICDKYVLAQRCLAWPQKRASRHNRSSSGSFYDTLSTYKKFRMT
jgi:hypothetical protein